MELKTIADHVFKTRRIATIRGIPIGFAFDWILFTAIIVLMQDTWKEAGNFLGLWGCVWLIVLIHELGHALTAQYFGVPCNAITFHFLGGAAHIEITKLYHRPFADFMTIFMGPFTNFVMALIALPLYLTGIEGASFFLVINVMLLGFNLLPVYPMDGGRMLRTGLGLWYRDHVKATKHVMILTFVLAPILCVVLMNTGSKLAPFIMIFLVFSALGEYTSIVKKAKNLEAESKLEVMERELAGLRLRHHEEMWSLVHQNMPLATPQAKAAMFIHLDEVLQQQARNLAREKSHAV